MIDQPTLDAARTKLAAAIFELSDMNSDQLAEVKSLLSKALEILKTVRADATPEELAATIVDGFDHRDIVRIASEGYNGANAAKVEEWCSDRGLDLRETLKQIEIQCRRIIYGKTSQN